MAKNTKLIQEQASKLVTALLAEKKVATAKKCTCGVHPKSEWGKSAHMKYCPLRAAK